MHNPVWIAQTSLIRMNHATLIRNFGQANYFVNMFYKIADGCFIVAALVLGSIAAANCYSVVMNLRE